jgi:N-acetylglucosaminyldiphosphoundecaprenol N-acetyl-beta-D-mannosaminyltransferase
VWIHENLEATQAKLAMGVGGLFDFYSGRIPRAPVWVREIGMEWVFRFVQEPKRLFRRYFAGNFVFIARVLLGKAS